MLGRHRPEGDEELGDVLDLGDEPGGLIVLGGGEHVGIVLEHRAAAGRVDDDRVEAVGVEGRHVPPRQGECRLLDAGVIVDGTAADLSARDHDLAAVLLKHPGRRGVGLGEHGVGHAAEEEGDAGPLGTDRRQDLGQPGPRPESRGSIAIIRRKVGGSSLVRPICSARSSRPSFWNSRAGASAVLTRPA